MSVLDKYFDQFDNGRKMSPTAKQPSYVALPNQGQGNVPKKRNGKPDWEAYANNRTNPLDMYDSWSPTQNLGRNMQYPYNGMDRAPAGGLPVNDTRFHNYADMDMSGGLPLGVDPTQPEPWKAPSFGPAIPDFNFQSSPRAGNYNVEAAPTPRTYEERMTEIGDILSSSEGGFDPVAFTLAQGDMSNVANRDWNKYYRNRELGERNMDRRMAGDELNLEGEKFDLDLAKAPAAYGQMQAQAEQMAQLTGLRGMAMNPDAKVSAPALSALGRYQGSEQAETRSENRADKMFKRDRILNKQKQLQDAYNSEDMAKVKILQEELDMMMKGDGNVLIGYEEGENPEYEGVAGRIKSFMKNFDLGNPPSQEELRREGRVIRPKAIPFAY